jgi:hypothetical protein
MIKVHRKKPTVSSGTSIFVLSADILNHFVVKDIKFFACLSDFFAISSRNIHKGKEQHILLFLVII